MDTVRGRLCAVDRLGIFVRLRSAVVWEVVVKTWVLKPPASKARRDSHRNPYKHVCVNFPNNVWRERKLLVSPKVGFSKGNQEG